MSEDFKIRSYTFMFGGYVEMILESPEGNRFFFKRRKWEISGIDNN